MTSLFSISKKLYVDAYHAKHRSRLTREIRESRGHPRKLMIGFMPWKRDFYRQVFHDHRVIFVEYFQFDDPKIMELLFESVANEEIYVWSYADPYWLSALCWKNSNTLCRVEDGFLRSVGLGASEIAPKAIIFDRSGHLHFHCARASRLHQLIRACGENDRERYAEQGAKLKDLIVTRALSKYNFAGNSEKQDEIDASSILVIGQVEFDRSIEFGSDPLATNEKLLRLAMSENPDRRIYYKEHPEVAAGLAKRKSAPLMRFPEIAPFPRDANMFRHAGKFSRVYTISSLVGFEMLLRGVDVVVTGSPWYAGWGLTDDRSPASEAVRGVTPELLLWCGYALYPSYYTAEAKQSDVFNVISELSKELESQKRSNQ